MLALAACLCGAATAAEISVADDTGNRVVLPASAIRIISLAPHLTELLFAIGAGGKVIATVESADYPRAARDLPRVGDSASLDLERIVALEPGLVLAWRSGNGAAAVEQLRRLRVPVFVSEPDSLARIAATLRALGTLTGREPAAVAVAAGFERRLAALSRRPEPHPGIRVLYQVWGRPIFTVSGRHVISEIITLCGGRNVFADLPGLAGQVDLESVLAADPEVIIASGHDDARPAWLDDWNQWPQIAAVRGGRLYSVPPDLLQRHTVRVLDGAERVCGMIEQSHKSLSYRLPGE